MDKKSFAAQILGPVVLALLVGGSAPWWWNKVFHSDGESANATGSSGYPIFVDSSMIEQCITRAGIGNETKPESCAPPNASVTLGDTIHTHGVIYTQTVCPNNSAIAKFKIPPDARRLAFSVGDYYHGSDCGGQKPMNAVVLIDDQPAFSASVATVQSKVISLSRDARYVTLKGESVDQDCRCDDTAWGSVRFER